MNNFQSILLALNTAGLGWLLFKLPRTVHTSNTAAGGIVLDSCALIDGRIVGITESGFLQGELIIPQFVLAELQLLADGSDAHKRARARFGLETAEALKQAYPARVRVDSSLTVSGKKTDDLLLELALSQKALLCTTDYNLNKVAGAQGIKVLNVNELSQSVRSNMLPGEEKQVKILQKGDGRDQGVGYLDDGTMVVVDRASKLIGTTQTIIIERSLQTVAGKMCFGHLKEANTTARRLSIRR